MGRLKIALLPLVAALLVACGPGGPAPATGEIPSPAAEDSYEIQTILPKDAIPSIDDPEYYPVAEADQEYEDDEDVIGLELEGEARAYSTGLLSSHEIVNDNVAGRPIAVTW